MSILSQHERFEIEVLDLMKSARMLDSLVFGGGTMLRLCHELNRYSVDLDFWFIRAISHDSYFDKMKKVFLKSYEITDAWIKKHTLLFELRSALYPRRLKIEIRREVKETEYETAIAFSRFATRQVQLRAHTLDQTMKNKIGAFLDRREIRDCYDIEFLVRRGVKLPRMEEKQAMAFRKKMASFKQRDFKVKLGSILESDVRGYYIENGFKFLSETLASL